MTLPRLRELTDYWMRFPPQHVSLAAITAALGGKSSSRSSSAQSDDYEAPDLQGTNDVTGVMNHPAFREVFPVRKARVVKIDNRKVN